MGRVYTPTYVCMVRDARGWFPLDWHGRPSAAALERKVMGYAKSLEPCGVNEHVSRRLGYIPYPLEAKVIRQADRAVVARWQAAPLQAW